MKRVILASLLLVSLAAWSHGQVVVQDIPASYLDTDGTLAANSDSKLATQKATKTYADTKVASSVMSAVGDTTYGGTAGVWTRLAGNTTTVRKFLSQTGTGSASAAPAWAGDLVDLQTTTPGTAQTGHLNISGTAIAATFSGALVGNASSATYASATTITDDTTTNATMYPLWVTANTGNLPTKVSSTKLYFNPSTGLLTATGFSGPLTGNASSATLWGPYAAITGPASTTKTFTLPNADATLLYSGGALGTPASGTLTNCTFPTLNQNTTGSAATLTTPRTIAGVNFDGSANIAIPATGLSDYVGLTYVSNPANSFTGWSSISESYIGYSKVGKLVYCTIYVTGTSNSTAASVVLPYTFATNTFTMVPLEGFDNGVALATPAQGRASGGGSTTLTLYKDWTNAAWTNSGTKRMSGSFTYITSD